jgi:hypothetical protein
LATTNNGLNWGFQTSPIFDNFSIFFVDTLNGWAGRTGIVKTTDGGGAINSIKQISTEIPTDFRLYQNYPNPFNPKTKIKYQITSNVKRQKSNVKIIIYDLGGRETAKLVDNEQNAGTYEVDFDGTNFSSGIYFYSLYADGNLIETKKMILMK